MADNSLFSYNSGGQQSVGSDDVFRDRLAGSFHGESRLTLPPLNGYYNTSDVYAPLQIPHHPHVGQSSQQQQPPSHNVVVNQPCQQYSQQQQQQLGSALQPESSGVAMANTGRQRGDRSGTMPLTPPGSPDETDPARAQQHQHHVDVKPSISGIVAAISGAGVADPSIAPAIARALSHQSRARPRVEKKNIPDDSKDDRYFERRKRNNAAAKKSRDSRKKREDEIAIRASFLEKENAILRAQVATLREEANSLRQLLLQKRSRP